jgi:hypothetical protein
MKTVLACLMMLAALATHAQAGHGTIEETDDGYVVEYSGDAADKQAGEKQDSSSAAMPASTPAGSERQAAPAPQRAERPERARRERAPRGPRAPNDAGNE